MLIFIATIISLELFIQANITFECFTSVTWNKGLLAKIEVFASLSKEEDSRAESIIHDEP